MQQLPTLHTQWLMERPKLCAFFLAQTLAMVTALEYAQVRLLMTSSCQFWIVED